MEGLTKMNTRIFKSLRQTNSNVTNLSNSISTGVQEAITTLDEKISTLNIKTYKAYETQKIELERANSRILELNQIINDMKKQIGALQNSLE